MGQWHITNVKVVQEWYIAAIGTACTHVCNSGQCYIAQVVVSGSVGAGGSRRTEGDTHTRGTEGDTHGEETAPTTGESRDISQKSGDVIW